MRRRLNLRLLIWSLVVVAVTAGAVHAVHLFQVERNARWLLEYARAAKNDDAALERYSQYLKIRKGDLDATEEYALALDKIARADGDRWQVVSLLQPLLVRSGNRPEAREALVDNLMAIGRWEAAVTHLDVLLAELPADDKKRSEFEHKRAWCLDAMERFEAATEGYRRSIEADPTRAVAYVLLAEIYDYRLARDKEGLEVLDQAVDKNPESAALRLARFAHQRMFGTKEEASADLEAALKLEPKNPAAILAASRWAQASGDFEKARALVIEGIRNDEADEGLLKEAAELELRAGHADKALELATRGLEQVTKAGKQTRTIELQVFRADLLIDAGKIDQAEAEIRAVSAQEPTSSLPDFLRARLLVEAKNCRAAAELLEKIRPRLEQDPYWNSRVNSLLGLAYMQLGDLDRRVQALTRALRTDPSWPPLAISLAQAYLESGQPARALELVDGVPTAEAKIIAARAQLLTTLADPPRRRDWKKVDDAFQVATFGETATLDRVLLRADIARSRGEADKAEQILKDEMKRQLPEPKAETLALWLALAELAAARRDPDRALTILTDARDRFGDSAAIRIRAIRILAARATAGDIALFGHVVDDLDRFPADDRGTILRHLAEAWIRIGDPAAADAALRRAAAEMPSDLRSRSLQFELALSRGQMDEARRVLGEMHVAEGADGPVVAFADAMFEARTADDSGALERLLKEVEAGPLRKQPARQALVKAVLHERLHNTRALIDDLQTALDGGLRSAPLTSRLVQILIDERRLNEANAALSMLERTGPLPVDLWNAALDVAAALRDEARVRELVGVRYLEQIRDPGDMVRIAQALARIDDDAAARTCFNRAIDLAPHSAEPWTAAIRHLVRRNHRSDALVLANQVPTKTPARYRTFVTAQCAEALGEWATAESTYRKALQERPKDALHRLAFADFLAAIDRPNDAAAEYRTVIDTASQEVAARARRGLAVLLATTDPAEARQTLAAIRNPDAADRRVEAYLDGLDATKRSDAIRRLESSSGLSAAERFRLVQMLDLSGQTEASARQRERILTEQVETPAMLAYFLRTLLAQDRTDIADPLLERLRQIEPNSPRTAEMTRLRQTTGGNS